uniref:snRNA-activating protein complex subunit 4 n=1 Tax=Bactrocera latifrons TaxID=174628 RepID=A0A0K8WBB8_BACLA
MISINDENSVSEDDSVEDWSDSEMEGESNADYAAFSARYMGEITNLLGVRSQVNCENALILNQEMQQRLQEVRKRLQVLLQVVQQRYLSNEQRLKMNLGKKQRGFGMRGAYLKGGTFFFKGNMFFKDLKCRNCPNNQDYEYRKNVENEMFPMDFELCSRHVWSLLDKKAVVQAVKEQLVDYLADHQIRDKSNKSKRLTLDIKVHTEKLANLLTQVDEKFQVDWEQVSAHNLNYRHSPSSCKTMWQVYLHPSLKRSAWSEEENKRLLHVAQIHNYQNWEKIAESVSKRSDYQCFIQYQTAVCFMDTQRWGRWDKRDDIKLLKLIEKKSINGVIDWNVVASYFPHKPKKSLHQRYIYYLDPKISHEPFSPEEDLILLAAVEEYGEKFALFPRTLFPNRSITQLRMRYRNTLQTRHKLTPWSVEDDKKLMEFIAEHGTSAWLRCAGALGNHNRISCRTRFLTIKKFFAKNPEATLEDIPRKKTCTMKNSVITTQNWIEKVAELRENPDTVLVPTNRKFKKLKEKVDKFEEVLKTKDPPKCEVQSLRKIAKKVRKISYVERLRAVEQILYHFFKYSYNFSLGADVCTKPPNELLRFVATSLDFKPDSAQPYIADSSLLPYIERRCEFYLYPRNQIANESLCKPFNYTFPPSLSTAMAFRALCVQSAQVQLEGCKSVDNSDDRKPNENEKNIAIQKFRKQLMKISTPPLTLTEITPADFKEDSATSTIGTSASQPALDLTRVKNECSSEFLVNPEPFSEALYKRTSLDEVSKSKKKPRRTSKPVGRKRKLQTTPSETTTAVMALAEKNLLLDVEFSERAAALVSKATNKQPALYDIKQEHQTCAAMSSNQSLNSSSEPAEKRILIQAKRDKSDFVEPNIKTELEL